MRTLLVGDSHVRRFENYMKGSLRNETFNISDLGIFDFCGISGGSIANHAHTRAILSAVRNTRPQHVIVNLGGNDLDSSEDIECIISRLVSFASLLKGQFHICTIVILSFMYRSQTRNINISSYNSRVDAANQLLKSYVPQGGMLFWKLKGFTNSVNNIFSDGVHLNSLGQYKLYRQIRGILLLFTRNS